MTWKSDGSRFEGLWHMDRRMRGSFKLGNTSSGAVSYFGDFREDLFHGRGQLTLTDGNIYEGVFEEGRCAKFGKLIYRDGSTYLGEMKDFKRHGNGIYIKSTGERIEGEFLNDVAHGIA